MSPILAVVTCAIYNYYYYIILYYILYRISSWNCHKSFEDACSCLRWLSRSTRGQCGTVHGNYQYASRDLRLCFRFANIFSQRPQCELQLSHHLIIYIFKKNPIILRNWHCQIWTVMLFCKALQKVLFASRRNRSPDARAPPRIWVIHAKVNPALIGRVAAWEGGAKRWSISIPTCAR